MNNVNHRWRVDDEDDLDVLARRGPTRNIKLIILALFRVWPPRSPHDKLCVFRLDPVLANVLNIGRVPPELHHDDYFTTKFDFVKREFAKMPAWKTSSGSMFFGVSAPFSGSPRY
jgi:hypothetical protein